jgi:hypothetical protein
MKYIHIINASSHRIFLASFLPFSFINELMMDAFVTSSTEDKSKKATEPIGSVIH